MTQSSDGIPDFVHLHVHSQYSLLDGAIRLDPLLERTKEFGMNSVAVTDHGSMFAAVEFYDKANHAGVKPIIGFEAYMAPRGLKRKEGLEDGTGLAHLVLLAENNVGYTNLCKLASIAQLQGFYYKPRIDREVLAEHTEGVIALSACLAGEIPKLIMKGKQQEADALACHYQKLFGERNYFLEVQENGLVEQYKVNEALFDMSKRLGIPMVATNDCHYLNYEDNKAHEVLLCIQTGTTMDDPKRFKFGTDQLHFKSPAEMARAFGSTPEVLANTVAIADRCHIEFDFNTYHFPQFDATSEHTADELFEIQAREGFQTRMAAIEAKNPDVDRAVYEERLDYEVKTIIEMGFPGYFLIVADFIGYGKANGIPVGPGRGSAAGSIVAYSMNITELDPIEHGLIFERFLNPSRISMPDIDVDFCIRGREKVFNYVVGRYGGGDYVAQIITFGTLKPKAVIRDVGRALNIPLSEVDRIAKLVPDTLGIKLNQALIDEPELKELVDSRADYTELINVCRVLEGLTRHASTHAAGVVVSDKPLVEYLPLFKGRNGETITQLDMKRVEQIGLVKFDFLGLRNLTVIDDALKMIELQGIERPDMTHIDVADKPTFDLLCSGNTTGVFQLESSGMKDLLVRLRPEAFKDITALVALYRPGPLDSGMVDAYVDRKHGREPVEYLLPGLEGILEETYGVILYQEQVMQLAGVIANYTMAEADGLRKAMGKKIAAAMAEHRTLFMKGALENNHPEDKAGALFDLMEKFGGYGFNKSHSAAYALVCYQTAWLKAHFPVEFMAALLTSEIGNADGIVKFIAECKNNHIDVLPPDVNESLGVFSVLDGRIRFGLTAVKGVGEGPIEVILNERKENGPFVSIFEFCERVDLRKVNKRVLDALIKSGAFDFTGASRNQLMVVMEEALDHGSRVQKEKNDPQLSLFGDASGGGARINVPVLPDVPAWEERHRLTLEKEVLGFYISGHPLNQYEEIMKGYATLTGLNKENAVEGAPVRFGGMVTTVKVIRTKKGDQMAFVSIEDLYSDIEVVVFPSTFADARHLLAPDTIVMVEGVSQVKENNVTIAAERLVHMDDVTGLWTGGVALHLDAGEIQMELIPRLDAVLKRYPGPSGVIVYLLLRGHSMTTIELPDYAGVTVSPQLLDDLKALAGKTHVRTIATPPKVKERKKPAWMNRKNGNGNGNGNGKGNGGN
ncbi:DNA polymerase III subunit alpha [Desulfoluna sp.]|uniref:DNA polymerase III subunit alpha n=1 Tax=Desulfoluna sp. TaxID=2045199 RepID=UPI002631C4A5|nr:DNA polymerase III subunit alpha [Desulfoluna sp.]